METGDTGQDGEQESKATDDEIASDMEVEGSILRLQRAWLEPWTVRNH